MTTKDTIIYYSIVNEYTRTPGTRKSGQYTGEHFRETVLKQLVDKAIKKRPNCLLILLEHMVMLHHFRGIRRLDKGGYFSIEDY